MVCPAFSIASKVAFLLWKVALKINYNDLTIKAIQQAIAC